MYNKRRVDALEFSKYYSMNITMVKLISIFLKKYNLFSDCHQYEMAQKL